MHTEIHHQVSYLHAAAALAVKLQALLELLGLKYPQTTAALQHSAATAEQELSSCFINFLPKTIAQIVYVLNCKWVPT